MIYFLKNPHYPLVLIGTADWIGEIRGNGFVTGMAVVRGLAVNHTRDTHPWMFNLGCIGMIDGDERQAAALRELFWDEIRQCDWGDKHLGRRGTIARDDFSMTPWRVISPQFEEWLDAHARPWDGSNAEKLGIRGLGRPVERPAVRVSSLGEQMARRRPS